MSVINRENAACRHLLCAGGVGCDGPSMQGSESGRGSGQGSRNHSSTAGLSQGAGTFHTLWNPCRTESACQSRGRGDCPVKENRTDSENMKTQRVSAGAIFLQPQTRPSLNMIW